jgi:hypothetical protein
MMRALAACRIELMLIGGILISGQVTAQSPEKMSYQAVIRNTGNNLIANKPVGMRISILQGSDNGTPVYVETQTPVTNNNGLVTLEIGTGTTSGDFSAIDWSTGSYFLKTETDPEGGTNYTITGVSQLLSVPYSLYAIKAGNGFSGDYNDLSNRPDLSDVVTVADPQQGDLAWYNSGHWIRFPKGTEGQMLTVKGGIPVWLTYGFAGIQGYFQFVTYKPGSSNPVAYGFIAADGTVISGSGNFTCTWNSLNLRYEIAITGETYYWTDYSTQATLASHASTAGAIIQVGSVSGILLIYITRLSAQ